MSRNRSKTSLKRLFILIVFVIVLGISGYLPNTLSSSNTVSSTNVIKTSISDIPEYHGDPYVIINNNIPTFNEQDYKSEAFETYSDLDNLGRCGVAYAKIGKEIMPSEDEERKSISEITPSGWKQADYKEIIEYYYNKFGIKWYTFHAGSFEALKNREVPLKHVEPIKWKEIVEDIQKISKEKKLKIVLPRIFLNGEEMKECEKNLHTYCANGGSGLQIWLEKDIIRCTYCPLLAELHPEFTFSIDEEVTHFIQTDGVCAVRQEALDKNLVAKSVNGKGTTFKVDNNNLYSVCRFYSIREQY